MDAKRRVISVNTGTGFKAYRIAERADIRVDGAVGTIEQLKPGATVMLGLVDSQTVNRIAAGAGVKPVGSFAKPAERKVVVKIAVDGRDVVKIQNGMLWVEHKLWGDPSELSVNGRPWKAKFEEMKSNIFTSFDAPLAPFDGTTVEVTKVKGRGVVKVNQKPSASNGQLLAFEVDDAPQGGRDLYEIRIT